MRLDPNLTLNQLVSCDSCYAIFSPDNILEGARVKKHTCPKCQDVAQSKQDITKSLRKQLDKKFNELYENLLIEVTRIIDVRLMAYESKEFEEE